MPDRSAPVTETRNVTLTEFLLERIAEDEAQILNHWDSDGRARIATMWVGDEGYTTVASDHADEHWCADGREVADPRHVRILFDSARALAECAAKRRIIEAHPAQTLFDVGCDVCANDGPCDTMRALASVYSDHPDFNPARK
jgi:hypothetical protein